MTAQFEALNKLAVEAFKNNDLEGAVRIFTEAWELGQNHANLANQLRIILYNRYMETGQSGFPATRSDAPSCHT